MDEVEVSDSLRSNGYGNTSSVSSADSFSLEEKPYSPIHIFNEILRLRGCATPLRMTALSLIARHNVIPSGAKRSRAYLMLRTNGCDMPHADVQ